METDSFDVGAEALAQCASEPIHIPGSIQPWGVLLALDDQLDAILVASANAALFFGVSTASILASPASTTLGAALVQRIRTLLRESTEEGVLPVDLAGLPAWPTECTVFVHRSQGRVIVELVDESPHQRLDVTLASTVLAVSNAVRHAAAAAVAAPPPTAEERRVAAVTDSRRTVHALCDSAADAVRRFTGYDRVMIYEFDADGHGTVVAEARHHDVEPLLGLHYPATDIPAQARALYLRTRVRVLGDVDGAPIPLVTATAETAAHPLDLSYAVLRSMSPVHLQYLRNMKVTATLTVSIIIDGALWGLIACHHRTPKWPSHAMREASDVLSEFISVQLTVQQNLMRAAARARAATAQQSIIQRLMRSGGNLEEVAGQLQEIIPSDGLAVVTENGVYTKGTTPSTDDVRALVAWLETRAIEHVVAFDALGFVNPAFADFAPVASGVLALNLGGDRPRFVLWFRPEESRTVRWAGAPTKVQVDDGGIVRLTPRASFEEWREQRRGRSHPWTSEELLIAADIRGALVEIVLGLLPTLERLTRLQFARIRAAVDAASDAIAMTDDEGRLVYGNRAFRELTDARADQLPAPEALFGVAPLTVADCKDLPVRRNGPGVGHVEVDATLADGSAIPVSLLVDPILDDEGNLLGTLYIATDIRARRSLEAERLRLEQNLMQRQKLESIGLLAGGIAHDFNNLLTTVVANAALAMDALPADSVVGESIAAIDTAAQHGAALCRELLAYAGRGRFIVRPISVSALLDEMGRLLRVVTGPAATVSYRLAADLPVIDADEAQLRQVFMNLLVNATESLGDVGGEIAVTTATRSADRHDLDGFRGGDQLAPGHYVEVIIADTGHGMSQETLAHIFDPFYTTKPLGRGLGLAAVLGIISGHHGAIRVESTPGVGTTFSMLFPPSAVPVVARPVEPKVVAPTLGGGRMALVVDDEPGVRDCTRRILERAGFVVQTANDGQAGLSLFRQMSAALALVVSDVSMPELSGTALLKQIREDGHSIPALLVSGYTDNESQSFIVNDAHAAFMQKPFGVSGLLAAVGQLLAV
jgi:PAS domain S-box-containing protein